MQEYLVFSQTIEGFLRALGSLNDQDRAALKQCGIDPDKALRPAYPLEEFLAALDWAGQRLAPNEPSIEQHRLLGRRFMDAYKQTLIGRAMVAGMAIIGPWRTLQRLTHNFRTGNNFSETSLERVGPTEARLWCNRTSRPGWYLGIIGRGLEQAGAKDVQVEVISHDATGGRFLVKWT